VDIPKLVTAIENQSWREYVPSLKFPFSPPIIDRRVLPLLTNGILPNEPQIISRSQQYGVVVDLGIYMVNENGREHDNVFEELDKLEEWLRKIAEVLNGYLYSTLENQYEFLISDTAIKDSILNNEYLFTADGRSANHLLALSNRTKH